MPSPSRLDILIHCPGSHGTIADQIHRQACAFHELGLRIAVVCSPNFSRTRAADYPVIACLLEGATGGTSNIMSRKVAKATQTFFNQIRFGWEVLRNKPTIVLSGSHVTAQSALWIWPHLLASIFRKTIYTTNLHFSTREHNIGPKWWQKLNAALSFRPFRIGIAHKRFPHPSPIPARLQTVEVPLGPERFANVRENPKHIRKRWKVGRGKKVFLSFGPIRNHKNIDLAIRALVENPEAHLVIIGTVPTHKDRPVKYYQMLADDLGVSKRVFISEEFVPDEKRLSYFQAADFIMLTYSSAYHSQSATLPTAVAARRMVLGSSGSSPMRDLVRQFGVGVYVDPDSSEAVANAMATLIHAKFPQPDWVGFEEFVTWETNVTRILQAVSDYIAGNPLPGRLFEGCEDEAVPAVELLRAEDFAPPTKTRKPFKARAPRAQKPEPKRAPEPEEEVQPEPAAIAKPAVRRGRPPKSAKPPKSVAEKPKKRRGRPPKASKIPTVEVPAPLEPAAPKPAITVAQGVPPLKKRISFPSAQPPAPASEPPVAETEPVAPPPALVSEPAPIAPPAAPVAPPAPATPAEPAPQPSGGLLSRAFDSSRFRTTRPLPVFVSTSSIFASPSKPAAAEPAQNGHSSGTNGNNAPAGPRPRRGRKKALAA
jgi:glycosyltransferase involved in cell wall biosynthesis